MMLTTRIDNWIKGDGPETGGALIGTYFAITFALLMMTALAFLITFGDAPMDELQATILPMALIGEQLVLIPLLLFTYHRIRILRNIDLGMRFSKLSPYNIRLMEQKGVHYLTWCGCENLRDYMHYDGKRACLHDTIRIPIDVTDFKAQSKAITKLEKIYSRATSAYTSLQQGEKATHERLTEYRKEVESRLLEYNKLNRELSA